MKLLCYVGVSWGSIKAEASGSMDGACCGAAVAPGSVVSGSRSSLVSLDLAFRCDAGRWRCRTGRFPTGLLPLRMLDVALIEVALLLLLGPGPRLEPWYLPFADRQVQ